MMAMRIPVVAAVALSCAASVAFCSRSTAPDRTVLKSSGQHLIFIENQGPLEFKCNAKENIVVAEAFSVCSEYFRQSLLLAKKYIRTKSLNDAFTVYCQNVFKNESKCEININQTEANEKRFKAKGDLQCDDGLVFQGLYHCVDKKKSEVAADEVVTLVEIKPKALTAKCPVGKTISVKNAGQRGSVWCNRGHVESTLASVSERCNGKETCDIPYQSDLMQWCEGLKETHFVTYTCV